jgi:hypothetical protein
MTDSVIHTQRQFQFFTEYTVNLRRSRMFRGIIFVTILLISGCDGSKTPLITSEYEWIQTEPGLMMTPPITYRARYQWLGDTLHWSEIVTDSKGVSDIRSEVMADGRWTKCQHFDDDNWTCVEINVIDGTPMDSKVMSNGELKWTYFTTVRQMKKRYLVWNRRIPS